MRRQGDAAQRRGQRFSNTSRKSLEQQVVDDAVELVGAVLRDVGGGDAPSQVQPVQDVGVKDVEEVGDLFGDALGSGGFVLPRGSARTP